jgi:serine protease Do
VRPGPIDVPPEVRDSISFKEGFAPLVEKVSAAVVNIASERVVRTRPGGVLPFFMLPGFRDFFGEDFPSQAVPRERRQQSLGSGVLVAENGIVLTNNHLVEHAGQVRVFLLDGREFRARIIGTDPKTDIAVLKIDDVKFPFARLGDSDKVRVGEFTLAIGNPFGLGQTVTAGIVSAVGRSNLGIVDYEDFIQTDAAINPGNSGGALINLSGELIGINTAIITRGSQGNQGVGFAVPSNLARVILDQIVRTGRVVRGWLGVAIQDVTPAIGEALGLRAPDGVLISEVPSGSPADRAGLQRGDVIVELNGRPVKDSRDFRLQIAQIAPGTAVRIGFLRGNDKREVRVLLGELPGERAQAPRGDSEREEAPADRMGLVVEPISPLLRRSLSLPADLRGVVVTAADPAGRAASAGLRPGDVIREVNGRPVESPEQFSKAAEEARDKPVLLLVQREGQTRYVGIAD